MDKESTQTPKRRRRKHYDSETIFDDVFRTMAQKMPYLLIHLINEAFGTKYPGDAEFEALRNEHYEKRGKIITDSIIKICDHIYHIECQSQKDGMMALRMIEYDFAIALDHAGMENGNLEIDFPESCVLYIRNHHDMPKEHVVTVKFPNGQKVEYSTKVILIQDYTIDSIFEKKLYLFLPYYILRYEAFLKENSADKIKMDNLLSECSEMNERLAKASVKDNPELYMSIMDLVQRIADYVVPEQNPNKERIGEVMGGKILELEHEIIEKEALQRGIRQGIDEGRNEGRKEGRDEGRNEVRKQYAVSLFKRGETIANIADEIGITTSKVIQFLTAAGYAVK